MMNYLRKKNKRILAIVGVFLMVAFIIPSVAKRPDQSNPGEVMGKIGDEKGKGSDLGEAAAEWHALTKGTSQRGYDSYVHQMLGLRLEPAVRQDVVRQYGMLVRFQPQLVRQEIIQRTIGQTAAVVETITNDPAVWYLLKREARRLNVRGDPVLVEREMLALASVPTDDP